MAVKPILNIIGADPLAGAEVIKEAHNENYELLNDFIEDVQSEKAATDAGLQDQINNHLASVTAHTASSIVNDSLVSGIKVSDALNTTKTRIDAHVAGTSEQHGSDDIINESSVVGTSVSNALNTVQNQVNALVVSGTDNTTIGVYSLTAGGSANVYTGTFASLTYFGGLKISATFNTLNTGASTFNLNSLGAKAIKVSLPNGSKSDLKGGELYGKVLMEYDGTDFIVVEKNFLNGGTPSTPTTVTQAITSLPSSVIKGRADWRVEGNTLYQAVVNGDFANGTAGWTASGGAISAGSKILSDTGDGSVSTPYVQKDNGNYVDGGKIFIKFKARVTNSVCTGIATSLRGSTTAGTTVTLTTVANPVQNQWYDFYGILTPTGGTGQYRIRISHSYADAATANGKVMEVDGNIGVFAIPLTGTPYENFTADQMNALVTMYFEGLQGVKDVRVKSVGKNLFDGAMELGTFDANGNLTNSTTIIRPKNYTRVKPNTAYSFSNDKSYGYVVYGWDKNFNYIGSISILAGVFTTPSNCSYIKFRNGTNQTDLAVKNMLNEGTTALPYEEFKSSEFYIPNITLNRLPNGVADEVTD